MTFRMVPDWLIDGTTLVSDGGIRCWLALCLIAKGAAECVASLAELAASMGTSSDTARRRIRELESVGAIHSEPASGAKSRWRFADREGKDGKPLARMLPLATVLGDGNSATHPLAAVPPLPLQNCHPSPSNGATPAKGGRGVIPRVLPSSRDTRETGDTRENTEARARGIGEDDGQASEPPTATTPTQAKAKTPNQPQAYATPSVDDYEPGFAVWFASYPAARRTNAGSARAIWRDNLTLADREAALEAIPRFAAVFARSPEAGQRYCKAADRWLKERCWLESEAAWAMAMAGPATNGNGVQPRNPVQDKYRRGIPKVTP